jgi:threonine dehydratase
VHPGAATLSLEFLRQAPGASRRSLLPWVAAPKPSVPSRLPGGLGRNVPVYAVQAAGAPTVHDSLCAGRCLTQDSADTFAVGLATRTAYEKTFTALREGLTDFITVKDAELASAMRLLLRTTQSLVEGAGAAGLAGLRVLALRLAGKQIGIVLSGRNMDAVTLRRVLNEEI